MTTPSNASTLSQLLGDVSNDLRVLAAQTVELARLESGVAISALMASAAGIAVSLALTIGGAGVLVSALVLIAIALGLPAWVAATTVGFALTIGGALSTRHFVRKARGVELTLRQTRDSVLETMEWLKRRTIV